MLVKISFNLRVEKMLVKISFNQKRYLLGSSKQKSDLFYGENCITKFIVFTFHNFHLYGRYP
jgi:hypothetical protein